MFRQHIYTYLASVLSFISAMLSFPPLLQHAPFYTCSDSRSDSKKLERGFEIPEFTTLQNFETKFLRVCDLSRDLARFRTQGCRQRERDCKLLSVYIKTVKQSV